MLNYGLEDEIIIIPDIDIILTDEVEEGSND
jgi:hypothetical protein